MITADFDYELPSSYIAQSPIEPRDHARLLVLNRKEEKLEHTIFSKIGDYLRPGDLLVLNQTRVIPARIIARKMDTGGKFEILLLRKNDSFIWEALVGGKGLTIGKKIEIRQGITAEVVGSLGGARRVIRFDKPIEQYLESIGQIPLPPYIHNKLDDPERYQTVYARLSGSVAAPTAGLHFTPRLFCQLKKQGIRFTKLTLHIGLDTFAPVEEEHPDDHKIHTEWCYVPPNVVRAVNMTHQSGGRIIAVGTTSVRALESAALRASEAYGIVTYEGPTELFILPGFQFKIVDGMITNFHLPRSTLVMLVSAFVDRRKLLSAYQVAKDSGYRFYSFGDAMLIL